MRFPTKWTIRGGVFVDVRGQRARGVERGKRIRSRVADAVANELVGRKDAPLAVFAAFSRVSSARRSMARAVWWTEISRGATLLFRRCRAQGDGASFASVPLNASTVKQPSRWGRALVTRRSGTNARFELRDAATSAASNYTVSRNFRVAPSSNDSFSRPSLGREHVKKSHKLRVGR